MNQIIKSTNDYSIFKSLDFNRDKRKKHLEAMKKILMKENLLHLHPIIVNEKMEVVDGQHRLEAAKELGLDIFYVQGNVSYEHILDSNLIQKGLSLNDVIKFYAIKDGNPNYKILYNYINDLSLSPKAVLGLIFGNTSLELVNFIKSGKFVIPNNQILSDKLIKNIKIFLSFSREKKISPISMFSSSYFTIAFRNLVLLPEFNEKVWENKLNMRWFDFKPQINAKEWTRLLISIYNWKNQNPITLL